MNDEQMQTNDERMIYHKWTTSERMTNKQTMSARQTNEQTTNERKNDIIERRQE